MVSLWVLLWVALVGAVATVLATAITLFFTNRREAERQEYEQERQEREIEERRWATLREERLRAYSTFARLTKIVDAKNPSPQAALGDAHLEIEMLADNPELLQAAAMLLRDWGHAWAYTQQKIEEGEEDPYGTTEFINFRDQLDWRRTEFMRLAKDETKPPSPSRPAQEEVQTPKERSDGSERVRMYEKLTSSKEIVDLSPPQALGRAESFLVGQGYAVVHRTATTLTVERKGSEDTAGREGAPKLVVMAVPQPDGGVRIKVRDDDRRGVQERQGLWKLWAENLPKRRH